MVYRVVYASSEDPETPSCDLLQSPGPASSASRQGWMCTRNCEYPQSLILELNAVTSLRQIQFLSHQSKIATKIELFVSLDADNWRRLGYLSLDSNERSNFMARELKSVFVDTGDLRFLKILLHRPHVNKLNTHAQVGLVGVFLEISDSPALPTVATATATVASGAAAPGDVRQRMAELQRRKTAAAQAENFDEAKRIKLEMEGLEISVRALKELEDRKQQAVLAEDFDTAKALKAEIARLKGFATGGLPVTQTIVTAESRPPSNGREPTPTRTPPRDATTAPQMDFDEVPAVARGDAMREFAQFRNLAETTTEGGVHPLESAGATLADLQNLPRPAPLSTAALLEHEALLEVFGEYVVASALSREWKLREAGFGKMASEMENISVSFKLMLSGFVPLLARASDDKNPQAFCAVAGLAISLAPNFRLHLKRPGEAELLLERLAERVGDANRKICDAAVAALIALGTDGAQSVGNFLLKNLRTKSVARLAPKTLAAKIAVVVRTIGNCEEDAALGIAIGVDCIKSQASVDGRQSGIALLKKCREISTNFRSLLEPHLADLRPQHRDLVFQELFPSPPIRPTSVAGGAPAILSARISVDGRCQFCGERSDKFATDGAALDMHYLKECSALLECELCHQIVEKAALQDHIDSYECQPLAINPI